ncbi:hypothetical protein KM043_008057 [Ampulex compressa]|nr:hypothetical protein KM043_008057 [Ampulex compressa]
MLEEEVSKAINWCRSQLVELIGEMRRWTSSPAGDSARKMPSSYLRMRRSRSARFPKPEKERKERKRVERWEKRRLEETDNRPNNRQQVPKPSRQPPGTKQPAKGEVSKPPLKKATLPKGGKKIPVLTHAVPSKDETKSSLVFGRKEKRKAA